MLVKRAVRLPSLIDRARQHLASARSSAEVLDAKAIADAALHYAKLTRATNHTHADCLRLIVGAEIRMADEIDRAQRRGDLAKRGDRAKVRKPDISELADLGVSRQRLQEWRQTRDAGMHVVEEAITCALAEDRAPTKADIQSAVIGGGRWFARLRHDHEWYTPETIIKAARRTMGGIDLDPASTAMANRTVKAKTFFTARDDGLTKPWHGRVWLNPPFSKGVIPQFADKVATAYETSEIRAACVLVNVITDARWFRRMLVSAAAVCFASERIRFRNRDGKGGRGALFGQAIIYFGNDPRRFAGAFAELGHVLTPMR